jgi:hypothetical protein
VNQLPNLIRVRSASIIKDQIVHLEFEDGRVKEIDLFPLMRGPIFEELLSEPELFKQVMVHHGTLVWPNGADIDPDVLYYGLTPAALEEGPVTHHS